VRWMNICRGRQGRPLWRWVGGLPMQRANGPLCGSGYLQSVCGAHPGAHLSEEQIREAENQLRHANEQRELQPQYPKR